MTTALYTASLVHTVMPRSLRTHVHSLLKEPPALASLFDTSLSILLVDITALLRYWKLSMLLSFVPFIMMFSSEGASPGCSNNSVFCRLKVSPKALVSVDRQLASSCRFGLFRVARAHSSAKRNSRTRASRTLILAFRHLRLQKKTKPKKKGPFHL